MYVTTRMEVESRCEEYLREIKVFGKQSISLYLFFSFSLSLYLSLSHCISHSTSLSHSLSTSLSLPFSHTLSLSSFHLSLSDSPIVSLLAFRSCKQIMGNRQQVCSLILPTLRSVAAAISGIIIDYRSILVTASISPIHNRILFLFLHILQFPSKIISFFTFLPSC